MYHCLPWLSIYLSSYSTSSLFCLSIEICVMKCLSCAWVDVMFDFTWLPWASSSSCSSLSINPEAFILMGAAYCSFTLLGLDIYFCDILLNTLVGAIDLISCKLKFPELSLSCSWLSFMARSLFSFAILARSSGLFKYGVAYWLILSFLCNKVGSLFLAFAFSKVKLWEA